MSHKWLNVHITYLLLSSIIVSIKKSANNIHTVYKQQFSADIWTILKVLGIFSYKTDFFWQWFISQRIWIWMERQNFWFIFNVGYNFKRKYEIFLSLLRTCLRAHTTVTWRHKEGSTIHQIPYWNKKSPHARILTPHQKEKVISEMYKSLAKRQNVNTDSILKSSCSTVMRYMSKCSTHGDPESYSSCR